MKTPKKTFIALSAASTLPCSAAVIASTDFDGRVLNPSNTATELDWVTNGVADPGNMSAFLANGTTAQALFDNNALVQNMFAPALNTGNGNTFWNTSVNLTVLSGATVSLESVSFDYWAISGSAVQNVNRRADFVVTLFDPSAASVGEVSDNVINGTGVASGAGTPVSLVFSSPINLTAPGTYTLRIRGGDIINNETGNHTAIDNLSINGTVGVIPEPSSLALSALGFFGLMRRRR